MDQTYGLEVKGTSLVRRCPGALVHPMEAEELSKEMWKILVSFGFNDKKLSVFDVSDADGIALQICEQMGVICEGVHVETVRGWLTSVSASEPYQKRLRGDLQQDPLHVGSHLQQSLSSSSWNSTKVSALGKTQFEDSWKPLSSRQRILRDQTTAKFEYESAQKDQWSKELYKELLKINAPILQGVEHCVGQERLHVAIAGKTRSSTLKRYLKTWRDWQAWRTSTWGDTEITHPGMFCEYLFCRFDEPCGASVPNFICKAVAWFEKIAGIRESEMVATSRVVIQVRDYVTGKLAAEAPPIRRAPRYPSVAIESLEAMVVDNEFPVGLRVVAWVKLLKIWAALRYDDVQKIHPSHLQLMGRRMTTTLRITKTSGPGKRIQEMPVCISEYAFVWDPDWLQQGFHLLKTHASFERDYLLPKLTEDWGGFQRKYATYQDVTSYSCCLRKRLTSYYDFHAVLPEDLSSFWTEHSERATLPTALAMLGVENKKRDLVGRWKPEASDIYVRSYNGLVAQLQNMFSKALRKPERFRILDEIDVAESADAWLRNRKTEIAESERNDIIQTLMRSMDSFAIQGDGVFQQGHVPGDGPDDVLEDIQDEAGESDPKTKRNSGFIVVTTGRNCKRLHKTQGGCWMAREKIFKESQEFEDKPDETQYTHVCRVCWPKISEGDDSSGETSSDSGQSSSSSSSDS